MKSESKLETETETETETKKPNSLEIKKAYEKSKVFFIYRFI